jgi:hypothetical protein
MGEVRILRVRIFDARIPSGVGFAGDAARPGTNQGSLDFPLIG